MPEYGATRDKRREKDGYVTCLSWAILRPPSSQQPQGNPSDVDLRAAGLDSVILNEAKDLRSCSEAHGSRHEVGADEVALRAAGNRAP